MATVTCSKGHIYDSTIYANCPYCNSNQHRIDFGDLGGVPIDDYGHTKPLYEEVNELSIEESGTTTSIFEMQNELDPVTGWIVCIEGPDKGKDYKIYARNNSIGRNAQMDIALAGDTTISRENHAVITYDSRANEFAFFGVNNKNIIYINGKRVGGEVILKPYDVIELGKSKMIFVPLCSDLFTWSKGLTK